MIKKSIALTTTPGNVYELRTTGKTYSGYFDDTKKLAEAARELSGRQGVEGVFCTINPVNPELLARTNNTADWAKKGLTTTDKDIVRRKTFLIDVDSATRPSGISATDPEKLTALAKAKAIRNYLESLGWPKPLIADSGNGWHLRFHIDLPNNTESRTLLENCLAALAEKFNDSTDKIDRTVFNASRICKIYGTLSAKGADVEERPHRVCRIHNDGDPTLLTLEQLQELAATRKATSATTSGQLTKTIVNGLKLKLVPVVRHAWAPEEMENLLDAYVIESSGRLEGKGKGEGGWMWHIACVSNPDHQGTDAYVSLTLDSDTNMLFPNYHCSHDSCMERRGWKFFRNHLKTSQPEAKAEWFEAEDAVEPPVTPPSKDKDKRFDIGEFSRPAIVGGIKDYILKPLPEVYDGWFPRGDSSGIAGSSGSGKTTQMIEILRAQHAKEMVFGHETYGLDYLIIMADRGRKATLRTLDRMGIDPKSIPIETLRGIGQGALLNIKKIIEGRDTIPAIVFVEGADMIVPENTMEVVAPFLDELQKMAEHYHIAFVLSLGTPKLKAGDGYVAKRDNLFGTVAWGRKLEAIILMQYPDGDDTVSTREMCVLLRQSPPEKFHLIFKDGLLVENIVIQPVEPVHDWAMKQSDWFSVEAAEEAIGEDVSEKTIRKRLENMFDTHLLKRKKAAKGKYLYAVKNGGTQ